MRPRSRAAVPLMRALDSDPGPETRPGLPSPVENAPDVEEHLVSLTSPYSFEADQYRVLRQYVQQVREARGLHVLAVTSPAAGDGKTTTAINLAITLAQAPGSRVLLVDADLRRPFVSAHLGLDAHCGLSDALVGEGVDLADLVHQTPYNLSVLPAGRPRDNAYAALESPRLTEVMADARRAYECVVLDTPPVLLVPDCRHMSPWIDGFLLVVAAHRTPRQLLGEALGALDEAKVLGIVFNGDRRPLSGYYGKYYGKYYHQRPGKDRSWWRSWTSSRRARPQPWR